MAAIVLGLGGLGVGLLASTRGTGAGWAMLFALLAIATAFAAVFGLADKTRRGRTTAVAAIAVVLGIIAWELREGVSVGDLAAAAAGLLLLVVAAVVEYVWARYFYSVPVAAPDPGFVDNDDVIDAVLVDD